MNQTQNQGCLIRATAEKQHRVNKQSFVNLLGTLIVSLVATGPGFGASAGAQDPVPAQSPAAELLPAGPGKAAFTPARKTSFDEVTRQLDPGGDVFVYLATDRWLAALSTNVSQLRDVLEQSAERPGRGARAD